MGVACVQEDVRFVFGHYGHTDPEVYSIQQLLPARCARARKAVRVSVHIMLLLLTVHGVVTAR